MTRYSFGTRSIVVAVGGARIQIHWSWLPALGTLIWVLAANHFPRVGVEGPSMIGLSVVVAVLALVSVLVREIGRMLVASTFGSRITGVTLWPTGGIIRKGDLPSPTAGLRIMAADLLSSLVLGAIFGGISHLAQSADLISLSKASEVLSRFNVAFGIFNLIPALPLDGGVLLRSSLTARGASVEHATSTAVRAGVWFGILIWGVGAARIATGDVPGGIGLFVAGAIVVSAARAHRTGGVAAVPPVPRGGPFRLGLSRAAVGLAMLVPAATLYHPPLVVMSSGGPLDVLGDLVITDPTVRPVNGRYVAASVVIADASALHVFVALLRPGAHVVRRSDLSPVTEDPFRAPGDLGSLFLESRLFAAVAAARALDLETTLSGTGARVIAVGGRARAAGILPGDVIVAVDGRPVALVLNLRDAVTARPPGSVFALGLERAGHRIETHLRSRIEERSGGVPGLDLELETRDFAVDLPFEIRFGSLRAGGPSAGLAYALAIADLLDPRDIAGGRTIAATGIVDLTGRIDPIVGARAKVGSALDARADILVLPAADADLLPRTSIRFYGVGSVREALAFLAESGLRR